MHWDFNLYLKVCLTRFSLNQGIILRITKKIMNRKLRLWCAGLLVVTTTVKSFGQFSSAMSRPDITFIQNQEDTLATLSYGTLNADLADDRLYACHEMIPRLVKALKVPNSFQYKFPRMETVSIQYPADSSFRIFTWQLKVNDADYRYYGAIQWNTTDLKLVPLADRSMVLENPTYLTTTPDKWYGALYYNIKPFISGKGEKMYLLFGYDAFDVNDHRKIIDVMTITNGQVRFGAPVFVTDKSTSKARIIYEYSADANVKVNFDENHDMIVCDHLQQIQGILPGQGKTMVPDGSYEGYKLEKGYWKYISDVFDSGNSKNQRAFVTKKVEVDQAKEDSLESHEKKSKKKKN